MSKTRPQQIDEDGFPVGSSDDPATIRWRRIRADMLEIDLQKKRELLVEVAEIEKFTLAFAGIIRDAISRLSNRNDQEVMNEAIEEGERVLEGGLHVDAT